MDAYARAAKYPRGSILGQDFFDAGILIADTDYSIFSFKGGLGGTLPGVDIAFLLDAGAYHTPLDIPERIRPGTLQVRLVPLALPESAYIDPTGLLIGGGGVFCVILPTAEILQRRTEYGIFVKSTPKHMEQSSSKRKL